MHTARLYRAYGGSAPKVFSRAYEQTADTYQHASTAVFTDYAARHIEWLKRAEEEREALMN